MKFPFQMNYIELKCMYLNGIKWIDGEALHHQKEVKAHQDDCGLRIENKWIFISEGNVFLIEFSDYMSFWKMIQYLLIFKSFVLSVHFIIICEVILSPDKMGIWRLSQ